jgi:hypothetical protein
VMTGQCDGARAQFADLRLRRQANGIDHGQ